MSSRNHVPFSSFQLGAFAGGSRIWSNRPYPENQCQGALVPKRYFRLQAFSLWDQVFYFLFPPEDLPMVDCFLLSQPSLKILIKIMVPLRCCPHCVLTAIATLPYLLSGWWMQSICCQLMSGCEQRTGEIDRAGADSVSQNLMWHG